MLSRANLSYLLCCLNNFQYVLNHLRTSNRFKWCFSWSDYAVRFNIVYIGQKHSSQISLKYFAHRQSEQKTSTHQIHYTRKSYLSSVEFCGEFFSITLIWKKLQPKIIVVAKKVWSWRTESIIRWILLTNTRRARRIFASHSSSHFETWESSRIHSKTKQSDAL